MNEIPVSVAGAISIALIVGLGIFVYPWLLTRRYGAWVVTLLTVALAILFVVFQGGSGNAARVLAAAWALGPVVAGVVVYRIQRKSE